MANRPTSIEQLLCSHCGDPCDAPVTAGDHIFCCTGCKTVFELIQDSGLSTFYSIDAQSPGISLKNQSSKQYEHLDEPDIRDHLLKFSGPETSVVMLHLPQIHCSSCIYLLENLHRLHDGVRQSEVSFGRREALITFNPDVIRLSELAALLHSIGYEPDLKLDSVSAASVNKTHSVNRSMYIKIGVAGFAFGNIMLFSLPEYLSGGRIDAQFVTLFGMLNLIISLPVFFYSSTEFFSNAWKGIRRGYWSMDIAISLGIIAMFGRSVYEILAGLGVGYMDSFAMLVFLLLVGRLFQNKTYNRLSFDRDYTSYFPLAVLTMQKGALVSTPVSMLKFGDEMLIRHKELIPADALLKSDAALIDYSFVNGESAPVSAVKGQLVYAGGRVSSASAELIVKKEVAHSYLTQLWNHEVFQKEDLSTLTNISNRFSRYFAPAILIIAVTAALYWLPTNPMASIDAFTAVLIIACPCALALSAPFTLGSALNILAGNGVFLKNPVVLEKLASVHTIVFDKTGTITETDHADVVFKGDDLSDSDILLLRTALRNSNHPLSRLILKYLGQGDAGRLEDYREEAGKGFTAIVNSQEVKAGSAEYVEAVKQQPGGSSVFVSVNGEIRGYFYIRQLYRPGIRKLIDVLKNNFRLALLSGDNDRERDKLYSWFGPEADLRFEQSPEDKLKYIREISDESDGVLMIGDGLNDAGALKSAHVGLSVADNTASFTPACDGIVQSGELVNLNKYLRFARISMHIVMISFMISLLYNFIGLTFAVQAALSPLICAIIMPVSSITVILFTTLSTRLAAKKLEIIP